MEMAVDQMRWGRQGWRERPCPMYEGTVQTSGASLAKQNFLGLDSWLYMSHVKHWGLYHGVG